MPQSGVPELPFLQDEQCHLYSVFLPRRHPFLIVPVVSSGSITTGPCPCCAGGPKAECRWDLSREGKSLPSPSWPCWFWCSPGCVLLSVLQAHTADWSWAFHPLIPTSPSPQGPLYPLFAESVFIFEIASTHVQELALSPSELDEVHMGPPLMLFSMGRPCESCDCISV